MVRPTLLMFPGVEPAVPGTETAAVPGLEPGLDEPGVPIADAETEDDNCPSRPFWPDDAEADASEEADCCRSRRCWCCCLSFSAGEREEEEEDEEALLGVLALARSGPLAPLAPVP